MGELRFREVKNLSLKVSDEQTVGVLIWGPSIEVLILCAQGALPVQR